MLVVEGESVVWLATANRTFVLCDFFNKLVC